MTAIDVPARIRATALAEIDKQCFGEDFGFDCALFVTQAPNRVIVGYNLVTTCRSPLLGQPPLMNIAQLLTSDPDAAAITNVVTDAMRELRQFSAKILRGEVQAAPAQSPN